MFGKLRIEDHVEIAESTAHHVGTINDVEESASS